MMIRLYQYMTSFHKAWRHTTDFGWRLQSANDACHLDSSIRYEKLKYVMQVASLFVWTSEFRGY